MTNPDTPRRAAETDSARAGPLEPAAAGPAGAGGAQALTALVDLAKALSDPGRVRIVCALRGRELCVCQLVELLGLATSTVSKHMAILRQARLVESRKDGRWVYYRRATGRLSPAAAGALAWCDAALAGEPALRADAARVEEIVCTPLDQLCRT